MIATAADQDIIIVVVLQLHSKELVFAPKSLQAVLCLMDWDWTCCRSRGTTARWRSLMFCLRENRQTKPGMTATLVTEMSEIVLLQDGRERWQTGERELLNNLSSFPYYIFFLFWRLSSWKVVFIVDGWWTLPCCWSPLSWGENR